jgi:hypothetical protein
VEPILLAENSPNQSAAVINFFTPTPFLSFLFYRSGVVCRRYPTYPSLETGGGQKMKVHIGVSWLALAALSGCILEGDNEGQALSGSPAGVYEGSFTEQPTSNTFDLAGGVAANGSAFFISFSGGRLYAGSIGGLLGGISGSFRAYDIVSGSSFSAIAEAAAEGTVSGSHVPRDSISGTFIVNGSQTGTISLNYLPLVTEQSSSLSRLQGTYTNRDSTSGFTATISISDTGVMNGSDSEGCEYSGTATVLDSSMAIYGINGSFSCPGDDSQTGSGLALLETTATSRTLTVGLSNQSVALAAVLRSGT